MNFLKRLISSVFLIFFLFYLFIAGKFEFVILLILFCLITIYEWLKLTQSIFDKLIGAIFIIFSFLTIYLIKENDNENNFNLFIFVILISISTDLGGYVFGKILKGPKLTKISPNKTYSGVLGAFIFSMTGSILFISFNNYIFLSKTNLHFIHFFFIVIVLSTFIQIGDLTISFYKRKANVKDTGGIIPGHGGLLDRIDGMIFSFPSAYFFFKLFEI